MGRITLIPELRTEYVDLFQRCVVRPERAELVRARAVRIAAGRARYESCAVPLGVPWFFVGVIHSMEAGLDFDAHLHNGDPLSARTVNAPAGRPKSGSPPFTWEGSARDALIHEGLDQWRDWSLSGILYRLEAYNGFGYRTNHPEVLSPYLWSFSNHYTSGKYIKDHVWSPTAMSQQIGAALLLLTLVARGDVDPALGSATQPLTSLPLISYYRGGPESEQARKLQVLLNNLLGTQLVTDGKAGQQTSDALERLVGHRLVGDPRG